MKGFELFEDIKSPLRTLTISDFFATFRPIENLPDQGDLLQGRLFAAGGLDESYVRKIHATSPLRVWTVTHSDDMTMITNGMLTGYRVGYLITEVPAEEGITYEALDPDELFYHFET
ncbi:hypothetical protein [Noviherbaspirillum malthae]|uniref:hypothetical protein n=1 Tax=Noviherbaspirillum malthae TaxID=1260987 RepID=UPI00188FD270|nr:hypothetical protein [Noviherbaspirillum malthae]